MSKKVLIICYYWPPAGGPGVQRWLKFVKYLPDFNIEPIVYIPENPNYPLQDESLQKDVSEKLTVLKLPISEPYKLAKVFSKQKTATISKGVISEHKKQNLIERLLLYIRGNFFIPDARIAWVKPSVNYLSNYISKNAIDIIITTGPPHSLHLIGLELKAKLGVKWLADFRDPWTTIGYHKQLKLTKSSRKKHKTLENKVLNAADSIIVTSNVTKTEFKQITKKPISVITNGYDNENNEVIKLDEKFTLSHIGSLLSKRNPLILWQVLSDLIKENTSFSDSFLLNFVGFISEDVLKSINDFNLTNHICNIGYVNHNEAVTFQKKSQILLLIEIDSKDTKSIIPGKLFEYLVSGRPILALGPKGSDIESIIKETNSGNYFDYSEYDKLKSVILEYFKAYQNNTLKTETIGLQKYSRRELTKKLTELL